MSAKEKILYSLALLFFVTFYLPSWAQTASGVVIGLMVLFSFAFTPWSERWALLKERKHIIAMVLFMVLVFVSLLLSENQNRGWRYLDTRLALCYLPISIGLIQTRKNFRDKMLLGFAIVTTLACAVMLAWSIDRSNHFARPELLYNDSLTELIERQSIYISLLVTLAIFIYGYHLFFLPLTKTQMVLISIGTTFLYVISYLLASRNMMVVLYATTISFVLFFMLQRAAYMKNGHLEYFGDPKTAIELYKKDNH